MSVKPTIREHRFGSLWDFIVDAVASGVPYWANPEGAIPSQLERAKAFLRTEKGVEMHARYLFRRMLQQEAAGSSPAGSKG